MTIGSALDRKTATQARPAGAPCIASNLPYLGAIAALRYNPAPLKPVDLSRLPLGDTPPGERFFTA
jgi:hypothetical protein